MEENTAAEPRFFACHGEIFADPENSVVFDNEEGRIIATFHTPNDIDPFHPYCVRQADRAEFLAAALNNAPRLKVGDRVQFVREAESYPHGIVDAGTTGTVAAIVFDDMDRIEVRIDHPAVASQFAEWDGAIWLYGTANGMTLKQTAEYYLRASTVPAPVYLLDGDEIDPMQFCMDNDGDEMIWEEVCNLTPGESVEFGGGAAPVRTLERVR